MKRPNDPDAPEPAASTPGLGVTGDASRVLGGADELGHVLARWAAEARVDDAARARTRRRWLQIQAEEEASVAGTLLDLAERGRPVLLDVGGQRLRTRLVGLGGDFVAGRSDRAQHVLVRLTAIETIRTEPGAPVVRGDRAPLLDVTLATVLGPVAAERPDVLVRTRSGGTVRGQLRSASAELVQVRVDGDPPTSAWIPIDPVVLVIVEP